MYRSISIKIICINAVLVTLIFIFAGCGSEKDGQANILGKIENGNIIVKYNDMMYSKVISKKAKVPLMRDFQPSEYIRINGVNLKKFRIRKHSSDRFQDSLGIGTRLVLIGNSVKKDTLFRKN